RIAGLDVIRILNEPTAASLAYGLDKLAEGRVAVYDLGGGTFDISILKIKDGIFEVLATAGDTRLGGDDIDIAFVDYIKETIRRDRGTVEFTQADGAVLLNEAVRVKHVLSAEEETDFSVKLDSLEFRRRITRKEFEEVAAPVTGRTIPPVRQALADAKLRPEDIDEVVLVGGMTRMPLVRKTVAEIFGKEGLCEINPDEVVAIGAAVQADILTGGRRDMLLLDVIPLSLGIETFGGTMTKIIHRNSTIPASATEMFTTFVDNQTGVDIHVLQGEREFAADCRSLARFRIRIQPQPAGIPRVEVKFLVDANGILNVAAIDQRTGAEQGVSVKPTYGLTDEDVEKMILESFEYAEKDVTERLLVEAKQEAELVLK
ncbi:MAG: Hsp70 family protein, partial [Deltaproteobacteria bacterium]|nr:Hsp70 family protein [Deltaproteobacteria bacterium]